MSAILIFGAAAGAILGRYHFKVFALVPVILVVVAAETARDVASGLDQRTAAFDLLMAVLCPQIGYLAIGVGVRYIVAAYLRMRATRRRAVFLHTMQITIGQELKTAFELPQGLPQEMVALLTQMK